MNVQLVGATLVVALSALSGVSSRAGTRPAPTHFPLRSQISIFAPSGAEMAHEELKGFLF